MKHYFVRFRDMVHAKSEQEARDMFIERLYSTDPDQLYAHIANDIDISDDIESCKEASCEEYWDYN